MELGNDALKRYSRQLVLPEVGLDGQRKIRSSRVLCVGAGGLGSPVALYLAAAGVGRLGIVDSDIVELSNLHRQILHETPEVGQPKTSSAATRLGRMNPDIEIVTHPCRLTSSNAEEIIREYDIVVDGTDNFPTRFLVNDACVMLKKPNVYGSILRFEGQASVFGPHLGGPCYRCLYPEPPPPGTVPSCAEGGVMGALPGIIGTIQAMETLKLILGAGESLMGRLMLVDALKMRFREIRVRRDPGCPVCGEEPTITSLMEYEPMCGIDSSDLKPGMHPDEVTVQDMKRALEDPNSGIKVLDVREPGEYEISKIEGVPLAPLSALRTWIQELDPNQSYYFTCKVGVRSMQLVQFLQQQGFKSVKSVQGGITSWSAEIDPRVPRY